MFTVIRRAAKWGLVAAVTPIFSFAQAPAPGALPPEPQTQQPTEGMQAPSKSGQESGSPHPLQLDAQHRPITAGGFVKSGPIVFEDVSEKAGVAKWTHKMGTSSKTYIVETKGSGVGLIDFDNDGWLDIYIANGSTFNALDGKEAPPHAALFHNNHDGTFTDVAAKAGVTNERWGFGVAIADYDNDGWPDIFVSNWGKNRLYHNNHDGTFTDRADKAGVALDDAAGWHTGATWGDFDGDGRLDLFVAGYLHYDRHNLPTAGESGVPNAFCTFRGEKVSCGPRGLKGEQDHLFHNNGDGTFTDVSEKAGVADKPGYYGLASMGIAVGDYENDGMLDIFDTTFSDDYKPLYHNEGDANLTDISYHLGIAEVSVPFLSWGDAFMDYDNDGWKDLLMSDGHVYPEADKYAWGTSWKQRPMLFHNLEGKRFETVPAVEGTGLAVVIAGRGMAVGDLFNDGKLDAVINVMDGHPVLLRNVNKDKNHWLELKLVGGPKSPRDAVGATVYVSANGMKQRGDVISGGSYLSSNDPRPHFGLGQATSVDAIEVHWPDGKVEKFKAPAVDRIVTITEGTGK